MIDCIDCCVINNILLIRGLSTEKNMHRSGEGGPDLKSEKSKDVMKVSGDVRTTFTSTDAKLFSGNNMQIEQDEGIRRLVEENGGLSIESLVLGILGIIIKKDSIKTKMEATSGAEEVTVSPCISTILGEELKMPSIRSDVESDMDCNKVATELGRILKANEGHFGEASEINVEVSEETTKPR